MAITFIPVDEHVDTFSIYKEYMKPWIDNLFGWNESFQLTGFKTHLRQPNFSWIVIKGIQVGIICLDDENKHQKLSLLIIFKEYQRQGYSLLVLKDLINTLPGGEILTWNSLKNNLPAVTLYSKIKTVERSESEYFYHYRITTKSL